MDPTAKIAKVQTLCNLLIKLKHTSQTPEQSQHEHVLSANQIYFSKISKIDGVPVTCGFQFTHGSKYVHFFVKAKYVIEHGSDFRCLELYRLTKNSLSQSLADVEIYDFAETFLNILPYLKLGTSGIIYNSLCPEVEEFNQQMDFVFAEYNKNDGPIQYEGPNECSVCFGLTSTRTMCKHSLCFRCWFSIPVVEHDDEIDEIPCPVCRRNINECVSL